MKEKTKIRLKIAFRVGGETVLYALLLFAFLCMADRFPTEGYYAETAALAGAFERVHPAGVGLDGDGGAGGLVGDGSL